MASSPYASERLWATADDGTDVPITFVSRPELRRDGGNPCLLKVYGAYEVCADGRYTPALASLLDRGVVYAIAHVRGGGELGRRWWLDGRWAAKHHTFSDLVAVRDHLVAAGRVAPDGVVVRGLSAGGLVTGAVYTTHPEKWAGVIAEAPAVDLLNQMLDPRVPLTVNEYDEWGDPTLAEQFEWMRAYSPYENLSDRPRPPLLVTGILRDPRVQVSEPTKWVAALRALDTYGNDVLYRVELGAAAHKGPSGRTGVAAYEAEIQAWVLDVLKA